MEVMRAGCPNTSGQFELGAMNAGNAGNKKRRQSPTGLPQYLKSEIYASQTIQAFACGFTCTAQLRAGKLLFRGSESRNIHLQAGSLQ